MFGHDLRRFTPRFALHPGAEVIEHLRGDGLLDRVATTARYGPLLSLSKESSSPTVRLATSSSPSGRCAWIW